MNKITRRLSSTLITDVFDCHCHIIDPRFPLIANQGYLPPFFTCDEYRNTVASLSIRSGAIVSGSFQGYDQTYLIASLKQLSSWIGVAQVPHNIKDEEIISLNAAGVRACRFNLFRGSNYKLDDIIRLANRCYNLVGWHAEFYIDSSTIHKDHIKSLSKLHKFSIDHLGMSGKGLQALLELVDAGAKVKATGFGRVDMDIPLVLEAIASRNQNCLMFGTDLPSTRAKRPFKADDIDLIIKVLGNEISRKVLWSNAIDFYKPNL